MPLSCCRSKSVKPFLTFVFVNSVLFSACSNAKKFTYFKDVPTFTSEYSVVDTSYRELTIAPDDILQIDISSVDPEATSFFTTFRNMSSGQPATSSQNSYLVDKAGAITIPVLGIVQLAGSTTVEAGDKIKRRLTEFLKDPIVAVRQANFKITVLGEVARPANYIIPNEKISLLDALGLAGDLTAFGRRDNILLIRQKEGKKLLVRMNLGQTTIFKSPYFYLRQNDVVYVEPTKSKAANTDLAQVRKVAILTSIASLLVVIFTRN